MSEDRTKEVLIIKNFAGIHVAEIELRNINIFIGPHASGKSVTLKLIYFFQDIINEYYNWIYSQIKKFQDFRETPEELIEARFREFFPSTSWPRRFLIEYQINDFKIVIEGLPNDGLVIVLSSNLKFLFQKLLEASKSQDTLHAKREGYSPYFDDKLSANFFESLKQYGSSSLFKTSVHYIPAQRNFYSVLDPELLVLQVLILK